MMNESSTPAPKQTRTKPFNYKKLFTMLFIFGALALAAGAYWMYSQGFVSTDDAYVNANVVQIASRVTGQVIELDVQNNEIVQKGQVLFRLDPAPFITAVNEMKAQLAIDEANLANAKVSAKRTFALVADGVISLQARDDMLARLKKAESQVSLDQASLQNAELNLQYTTVTAPANGSVSNLSLRPQDTVNANESQFALIADSLFWVDANFKETDLERIHVGDAATIKVDMYPNHSFDGIVQSISGGSGNAFALLPPQNATGNWVKVTQRVPVKVVITNLDASRYPLIIGTSAVVTIPTPH